MAGRPPKSLAQHIREGSFRPGRHGHLLAGEELPWPGFARLQAAYRQAASEPERQAIVRRVASQVQAAQEELALRTAARGLSSLEATLRALGRPGSFRQLERFFPRFLRQG